MLFRSSDTRRIMASSSVRRCAHLFDANDVAVTAVCFGFVTRYPLPVNHSGHWDRETASVNITMLACSRVESMALDSALSARSSDAECLAGLATMTASAASSPC